MSIALNRNIIITKNIFFFSSDYDFVITFYLSLFLIVIFLINSEIHRIRL